MSVLIKAGLLALAVAMVGSMHVAAQNPDSGVYVIKKNDTLIEIASRFNTSVEELKRMNSIGNPKTIQPGSTITVPKQFLTYSVKSGDTISEIAQAHGMSVDYITSYNNLSAPDKLKIGQVLKIPLMMNPSARGVGPPAYMLPQMSADIRTLLAKYPVSSRWKYIAIHHSATSQGSLESMDRYHKVERRMTNGLAYHFVIGNGRNMGDGLIGVGNRWKRQIKGGHLYAEWQNDIAIGICLVGNFEETAPTAKQMESLEALLAWLQTRTNIRKDMIMPHRKLNVKPTVCPGKYFPTEKLLSKLR
jgi:LysM repeat protein